MSQSNFFLAKGIEHFATVKCKIDEGNIKINQHVTTSSMYRVVSANLPFTFDPSTSSQRVLDFNTSRFGRLITDWTVENMNPVMTLYVIIIKQRYNKQLI